MALTSTVTGLVERCTTPPTSKKLWRGMPMLSVAAGIVRRPARVGKSSFSMTGKRRKGTPSTVAASPVGRSGLFRSSAQNPSYCGAWANCRPDTPVSV